MRCNGHWAQTSTTRSLFVNLDSSMSSSFLDDDGTLLAFAVSFVVVGAVVYKYRRPTRNYPPTLPSLPFVGSLPFMPRNIHRLPTFFMEKYEEMGSVFAFYAGSRYTNKRNTTGKGWGVRIEVNWLFFVFHNYSAKIMNKSDLCLATFRMSQRVKRKKTPKRKCVYIYI